MRVAACPHPARIPLPLKKAVPAGPRVAAALRGAPSRGLPPSLDVEAEVDHVAVAHGVVLALEAELAGLLGAELAAVRYEVVIGSDFRANEPALEIGMDHAGGLRRGRARMYRPGAHFLGPCGEIGLQAEQRVRGSDDAVQSRLIHAHVLEEELLVLVRHVGDLRFDGSTDRYDGRTLLRGEFPNTFEE